MTNPAQALFEQAQANDPNEQQREAQRAIAGDMPLMTEPSDQWVTLPRGIREGDAWETKAVVRELTGADEETLAKYRKDSILLVDAVTALGVESVGRTNLTGQTFDERTEVLRSLLIGEREQLFLAVAGATFGDDKNIEYGCPSCGETSDVTISLKNDIKVRELANPEEEVRKYTTAKNEVIEYRLMTGEDQFDVYSQAKGLTSEAQVNTLLLTGAIIRVDGKPVMNPRQFVLNLGMKDRAHWLKELIEAQPSPDINLTTECPTCEYRVGLPLSWELVFRP